MLHVLVVDDQSTSRIILEELVGRLDPDVRVHAFAGPAEALAWATRHRPDLVLTDYRMPVMSGAEFIRRLRALPHCADIPMVMVTVMEERAVKYAALEAGASDILTKPVDPQECRARCRNLLTLRRQQRLLRVRSRALERQVGSVSAALRAVDLAPADHALSVARGAWVAGLVGRGLGLDARQTERLESAAALRDIGMSTLPRRLRAAARPLSAGERALLPRHTQAGAALLGASPGPGFALAALIAAQHHERWDGSGYPAGLSGAAIALEARIVAVADVFAALTVPRPHRPARAPRQAAAQVLAAGGRLFDPDCTRALEGALPAILQHLGDAFDAAGGLEPRPVAAASEAGP